MIETLQVLFGMYVVIAVLLTMVGGFGFVMSMRAYRETEFPSLRQEYLRQGYLKEASVYRDILRAAFIWPLAVPLSIRRQLRAYDEATMD